MGEKGNLTMQENGVWTMPISDLDPEESMDFTLNLLRQEGAHKTVEQLEKNREKLLALRRRNL